jgi:predicted secreted protein
MQRYDRSARRIRVAVGESFVLELRALATAGYTWRVAQVPGVVSLTAERVRPAGPATGSPSVHEFEFTATRRGEGPLVMVYQRAWEDTAAERLEITVVAEERS